MLKDPIISPDDSDKDDQAIGLPQEHKNEMPWTVEIGNGSPEMGEKSGLGSIETELVNE
jgi:hypothetical protein